MASSFIFSSLSTTNNRTIIHNHANPPPAIPTPTPHQPYPPPPLTNHTVRGPVVHDRARDIDGQRCHPDVLSAAPMYTNPSTLAMVELSSWE
ncbi:hypothetical protein L3X38_000453 [Prunus dulcis]|uniref:Uncharacterized protein n=1 Tax=Prunus dulcis TaxID=3755 RepID=A0AAD4WSJ2_PRUDU|nr:hypothetical protein L3X38_000453 [Prunus dulcis]